jgi:hypothetical protein
VKSVTIRICYNNSLNQEWKQIQVRVQVAEDKAKIFYYISELLVLVVNIKSLTEQNLEIHHRIGL